MSIACSVSWGTSLQVLRRYLKQTNDDLQEAHQKTGPVDNLLDTRLGDMFLVPQPFFR